MTEDLMTYEDSRVEQWCEIMHDAYERAAVGAGWETNPASRKPWADVPEANKATMRAAVRAIIEQADAEWRAGHPPFSLMFTGAPGMFPKSEPVTYGLHAGAGTDEIEQVVESLGVAELGALAGIARAILVAVECKHYPQRWVEPLHAASAPIVEPPPTTGPTLRFEAGVDVDEPVPYVPVVDPPPGPRRGIFPLEEGDTGEALLTPRATLREIVNACPCSACRRRRARKGDPQ